MKSTIRLKISTTLLAVLLAAPSFASEVNINGFIRSSFDVSNSSSKYLDLIDNHGSWNGTQAGLTYSTRLNQDWSVAGQFHFRAGEGELNLDWGIATFKLNDSSNALFGRQKYPLGLLSENVDIGITYPWARPPQEFYHLEVGAQSGNFVIEGFDGVSLDYTTGDDWEFKVHPFIGEFGNKENSTKSQRKILGLKLEASSDSVTLQAGYNSSELTAAGVTDQTKITTNFGAKLEIDDLLAYLEYANTAVANSDHFDSKAGYLSVAYSFDKYQPVITIAKLEGQKAANASNGALDQSSVALGLAFHFNPSTIFKAQWKNIKPDDPATAGLISALPAGDTSIDVFSFTMDVVF